MSVVNQSMRENVKLNLINQGIQIDSQSRVNEMLALVQQFGAMVKQPVAKQEDIGKTAVSQMIANFAQNGLVRTEPAIFGVTYSSFLEPAANINPRTATLAALNEAGVTRTIVKPFGVSIAQIVS